ncbi:FISUMP domain-containing protein [Fibrobacter succinogenes]|uniref:FISUMP domain-containing protein n=1 Tax=Fibrobacter succinogenes TaxID=833 RepID=UPI0013D25306|nr:FISUMP domain-containing protein [Fibrobacter succinogenes]
MNSAAKFVFCCALSSFCLTACGGDSGSGSENSNSENSGSENSSSENGSSSKEGSDASREVDVKSSDDPVIRSEIRDSRTGETIETIQIGMYIWLTKNVNSSGWSTSSVCYDDDSENCDTYGKLFESWSASTACPTGFDVPLKRDWKWLGNYSAKYPTTVDALQLNYGGFCSDKSGSLECKGLGDYGKYLAQDGIAVFTPRSASPAFEEEQMFGYYQLRCRTYTYIVESKKDLPVCDSIGKENLGPFYVVSERTNYRCLGTRWEDDFSESCNHVVKNTAVTINDTMYICKYNSWQVADVSDARESCTAANDSTTMLFNGERYACEDGSWREFSDIEDRLGYCRGKLKGTFGTIKTKVDSTTKTKEYFCSDEGWRVAEMTDHVGECDSSRVYSTINYHDVDYVCRNNRWNLLSSLEKELGICIPQRQGIIDSTESGYSYICDSADWRSTVLSDFIGMCDSARIDSVARHGGKGYLCKSNGWSQLSSLENEIGVCTKGKVSGLAKTGEGVDYVCTTSGWTRAVPADIGGACDSTKQYKTVKVSGTSYYCNGTSWSTMSSIDAQLGFCTEKIQGKIDSTGEGSSVVRYSCESTGWKKMTALEFRFGFCNSKNDSTKKVVHDSVYVCSKNAWKLGTITDMFGVCDSLAAGKTGSFMGEMYGCRKKSWLKMSDFEIANGFCSEKNVGENIKVGDRYYECQSSGTTIAWRTTTDFKYVMGRCPSDTLKFYKEYKDTLYKCEYGKWWQVSINEIHGYCDEPGTPRREVVFNKQEYLCDYENVQPEWHKKTMMDSLQGYCTKSRVGDTVTYKQTHYLCDIWGEGYGWSYADTKRYMGQCTAAREGHVMFNGFNESKCTSGRWVAIVDDYMTDSRNNKKYKVMTVKNQVWMVQDLNYEMADSNWAMNSRSDARLYSFTSAKKACPSGWRLPTKTEWENFRSNFVSLYISGEHCLYAGNWTELNGHTADDFYGVGIYPTGYVESYLSGGYQTVSQFKTTSGAYFWASDGSYMEFSQYKMYVKMGGEVVGAAVRCVKK